MAGRPESLNGEIRFSSRIVERGVLHTAIMAELVGSKGRVTAVEIDPVLAAQARKNLSNYSNIEVVHGDGGRVDTGPRDAILINAGVTHPRQSWIDNLQSMGHSRPSADD